MTDKVIVIGSTDVGRRTCAVLQEQGLNVVHLMQPTDAELHELLAGDVSGVAVMLHDDIEALRYSLAIEHIRPGVRLFVAIFDRSVRHEMELLIPNCFVASPAYVAIPSMMAAALKLDSLAIKRTDSRKHPKWEEFKLVNNGAQISQFAVRSEWKRKRYWGILSGQMRSYDSASLALLASLYVLVSMWVVDIALQWKYENFPQALYSATAVIAGVTAPEHPSHSWQMIQTSIFMLITIITLATFGAGVVNHVLTGRRVGLIGRRVIPRKFHVVVVGLGQVGIRLASELKALNIPVVGIEQSAEAGGVALAREMNIPVVIGNASDVRTLKRANVSHARALCAMSSGEQDNIAVAVAARAMDTGATIVLRAGSNDAIAETRSLFSIGTVFDINGMTAEYVAQSLSTDAPRVVIQHEDQLLTVSQSKDIVECRFVERCSC